MPDDSENDRSSYVTLPIRCQWCGQSVALPKQFPFAVTANEVRVSEREAPRYRLYRVFTFARLPRLYTLPGPAIENVPARGHAVQSAGRSVDIVSIK
jgi:hypothetical protein